MPLAKLLTVTGLLLLVTGCGTRPTSLVDSKGDAGSARLTSECDARCKAALGKQLDIAEIKSLNPYARSFAYIGSPIVHRVNGLPSDTGMYGYGGAYNSAWDGAFEIDIPVGRTSLLVRLDNHYNPNKPRRMLRFEALKAHTYFVGEYYREDTMSHSYRWLPFVFDKTSARVVSPTGAPRWEGGDAPGYQHPLPIPVITK